MREYVLTINPGSTSTKVAVFRDYSVVNQKTISHSIDELMNFGRINDQLDFRLRLILNFLSSNNFSLQCFRAIVGRGGLLKPIPSGTYLVTEEMNNDLKNGYAGEHASNLGGQLALIIAKMSGTKAYIVDPVVVDEMEDIARISGMPEIERKSIFHALNTKAVIADVAQEEKFSIKEENIIVMHMGGGCSVSAIKKGRVIDVTNSLEEGGFTPERTGTLPVLELIKLAYSGKYTHYELKKKIVGKGGLVAYLNTNDCSAIEKRINNGDEQSKFIINAMAYQLSKEVGAMATVLEGEVRCIILTGGLAYDKYITSEIIKRTKFIAPIILKPGEDELSALNKGALRVLDGIEKAMIYEVEIKRDRRLSDAEEFFGYRQSN